MDITEGRFINYSDINDSRKVCAIGPDVIAGLYDKNEEIIGSYIKINGVNFMVIGTFKMTNSQGDSEEEANTIFIPFTAFGKAFNRGDNVGWMAITAHDQTSITEVKEKVFDFLKVRQSRASR